MPERIIFFNIRFCPSRYVLYVLILSVMNDVPLFEITTCILWYVRNSPISMIIGHQSQKSLHALTRRKSVSHLKDQKTNRKTMYSEFCWLKRQSSDCNALPCRDDAFSFYIQVTSLQIYFKSPKI